MKRAHFINSEIGDRATDLFFKTGMSMTAAINFDRERADIYEKM